MASSELECALWLTASRRGHASCQVQLGSGGITPVVRLNGFGSEEIGHMRTATRARARTTSEPGLSQVTIKTLLLPAC